MSKVKTVKKIPEIKGGHVFNSNSFQSLKTGKNIFMTLTDHGLTKARICFNISNGIAISGYKSTFGSIDFIDEIQESEISLFLNAVIINLRQLGLTEVLVRHWPLAYRYGETVHNVLLNIGFRAIATEINQHLSITQQDFKDRIRNNERKKLSQSYREGFHFDRLSAESLPEVYSLVKDTRMRKGFPVSMSLDELLIVFNKMPENYHLFGVFDQNLLIAASVSIRISDKVFYNFYHADHIEYRARSPLVMLNDGIYNYCRSEGIEILDLGISSVNEDINEGLFTFKENLGCTVSDKNTYELKYATT